MTELWPLHPAALGFLAFAVPILSYEVVSLVDSWDAVSGADRTAGTVIRFQLATGKTYAPVVGYEVDGRPYELVARVSLRPRDYTIGDAVVVCYHRERPAEGRLESFGELWLAPTILLCLGTILATLGVWVQMFGAEPRNNSKSVTDEV
jgi:hypothetical protein